MRFAISKVTLQAVAFWLLIAFVSGFSAYLFYRKGKLRKSAFISVPLLALYLAFTITITVIERVKTAKAQYNLVLFWSYTAIQNGRIDLRAEIFWNVILFIPIGILLSLLFSGKFQWFVPIISFLLSAGIEVTQLLLHRGLFEFDDMFHNTLGSVIGLLIFIVVRFIAEKIRGRQLRKD